MADRIYISSRYSPDQVVGITAQLARAGFAPSGECVWASVGDFSEVLEAGDRVVVHSLGVFDGSVELLGGLRLFLGRGATLYSLRESDLSARLTFSLVDALFVASVEGLLGRSAEAFELVDPSTVERLARMDRLVRAGVSMLEASGRSGCTRNVYYYYKRKELSGAVDLWQRNKADRAANSRTNHSVWPQLSL